MENKRMSDLRDIYIGLYDEYIGRYMEFDGYDAESAISIINGADSTEEQLKTAIKGIALFVRDAFGVAEGEINRKYRETCAEIGKSEGRQGWLDGIPQPEELLFQCA